MSMFLERYWARTSGRGDLGALLGDVQINPGDGLPRDQAAWSDWLEAVDEVLSERDRAETMITRQG